MRNPIPFPFVDVILLRSQMKMHAMGILKVTDYEVAGAHFNSQK